MSKEDFYRSLHSSFKKKFIISEIISPKEINEFQCFFKLKINSTKTDSTLEDVLVFIRGINGVTIVRSSETTKRVGDVYQTKLNIKYTPQTFNAGVSLEQVYLFLEKEIRKFGPSLSLSRLSPPPGELVTKGS
jgi:hypothetical protein